MRHIQHPGSADATIDVVDAGLLALKVELQPDLSLIDALSQALGQQGVQSAVLKLAGLHLAPFAYVMPALSRRPDYAVYFSDRHDAPGAVCIEEATVTFGLNNGRPTLHCHADWVDEQGQRFCGHVLPADAIVTRAECLIDAWALVGAAFEVVPDAETRFTLFKPRPAETPRQSRVFDESVTSRPASARPALALRLPPNVDVCTALEAVCRERGIRSATVRGGVGSTVGVAFDDGRDVDAFVTETLVRQGRVTTDVNGELRADIDVTLIDYLGGRHQGRLARGQNPVLVTFELVLEID
jgi:predicted DNA-binding protein with PD1-like motif